VNRGELMPNRRAGRRGQGPRVLNSFSLNYRVQTVGSQRIEGLRSTARPQDINVINRRAASQTEMNPQVILRKIAAAGTNFAYLPQPACADCDTRANRRSIAFRSLQTEKHSVIARSFIAQERRRLAQIEYDDVYVPVVKNVSESRAAP